MARALATTLTLAVLCATLVAVAIAGRDRRTVRPLQIPDHVHDVLDATYDHHMRYFPDFKYEGFAAHEDEHARHHQQMKNCQRRGTGPHDLRMKDGDTTPQFTRNPHMANTSLPYPKNVQWLINMFEGGYGIPRSYNDILPNGDVYWGTRTYLSVGAFDEYGKSTELDSMIGIQERTLTRFGLNLYDAAVWSIALSLWNLYDVQMVYQMNILYPSTTGPAGTANGAPGGITNIRADAADFLYGPAKTPGNSLKTVTYPGNVTHFPAVNGKAGDPVHKGAGAFYYRMIGPNYQMTDPMTGSYGGAWKFPWPNYDSTTSWNTFGIIHFNDWKPITGENVWGMILGPLQSLGLHTNGNLTNTSCGNYWRRPIAQCDFKTFDTTPPPVQLGISILPALMAMQSQQGSLFHCPWGAKIFPPDSDEGANVSNENNFSGYASINLLYEILNNWTSTAGGTSDETLQYALQSTKMLRDGLWKWFTSPSILSDPSQLPNGDRVVPQGGHINVSGYFPVAIDTTGGLAVDCQTWGMTVMGQPMLDSTFGAGTAYKIWQSAKKYAGYYKGTTLCGVGYTDLANSNGSIPVNTIWSAEWTFGAINMAQVLSQQYAAAGNAQYAQDLLNDAQSMYNQVVLPWPNGLRFPDGSYVYANKRFFIPWGWFSNPISALCSTGWSVFQAQNYDPFHWLGGNKPMLQTPPTFLNDDEHWQ